MYDIRKNYINLYMIYVRTISYISIYSSRVYDIPENYIYLYMIYVTTLHYNKRMD